ncbi:MAG: hypothetical protein H0U42_02345 [Thermoleophilaceae bacterium]|nr:hypothetical protein [Thermoleophilaceae bacterium]
MKSSRLSLLGGLVLCAVAFAIPATGTATAAGDVTVAGTKDCSKIDNNSNRRLCRKKEQESRCSGIASRNRRKKCLRDASVLERGEKKCRKFDGERRKRCNRRHR